MGYSSKSFAGLQYTILNNNFKKRKVITKNVSSILVLQGGSDTYCLIPRIIDAINLIDGNFYITVVVGPSFKCWKKLHSAKNRSTKLLKILSNVKNMSSIMLKNDLVITGGGMTLLELSYCGIPSIIICGQKIEEETANLLQKKGFGINLGFNPKISKSTISQTTNQLILDYPLRKKMNNVGKKLLDNKGTDRVVTIISKYLDRN